MKKRERLVQLYDLVTGDEDARVCEDIPEEACRNLPANFFLQLFVNFLTKLADELASAKLLFTWVLGLLGAPLVLISLIVPIRESGVLLPQLLIAAKIRSKPLRKYVWLFGSVITCLALWLCAAALFFDLSGDSAIFCVFIGLLAFALARGICSVAAKDVMGKTVSKRRRGTLTGLAASLSGLATIVVGLNMSFYGSVKSGYFALALLFFIAGVCWLLTSVSILSIREHPGASEGGENALYEAIRSLKILWTDRVFLHFLLVRILLLGVALAVPGIVLMIQRNSESLADVGLLMLASGVANTMSGYLWGRLADRSAVSLIAICCIVQVLLAGFLVGFTTLSEGKNNLGSVYLVAFFIMSVVLAGVRTARKTLLIDLANIDNRSSYVAVSNTMIGVFIFGVGAFVGLFSDNNPETMFMIYSAMAAAAAALALIKLRGKQHA